MLITPDDRIYVAGHRGMAGSAICRALKRAGYHQILTATRQEVDLLDELAVKRWFAHHKPSVVVLAAAKVGGIHANNTYPADFLLENLKIQTHVIENSLAIRCAASPVSGQQLRLSEIRRATDPRRSSAQGSPRIHQRVPRNRQDQRHPLCEALRKQHGFDAISLMPTNLYGPGDNYHSKNSHVIPALIRRFHQALEANAESVTCHGSGSALREFLHVDDLGDASVFVLEHWSALAPDAPKDDQGEPLPLLNVGTGIDLSIRELAEQVAQAVDYRGTIKWDINKPEGAPKKQLNVSRLRDLGWSARMPLAEGLPLAIQDFEQTLAAGQLRQ